jgi:hypothetical protein
VPVDRLDQSEPQTSTGAGQHTAASEVSRSIGQLGAERVEALEDDLEAVVLSAGRGNIADMPGWLR